MGGINALALTKSFVKAGAITSLLLTPSISSRIPRSIKALIIFLITLNLSNFPLLWHFKILTPWIMAHFKGKLAKRLGGPRGHLKLLTRKSPIGRNPFDPETCEVYTSVAEMADCDYNGHLSNSSYAKNLDQVRMNACVTYFPGFGATGGMMLLGGGYFHFVKEIPLHAKYEIRFYISGWDEKWIYLTGAFVTYPKKKKSYDESAARQVASQLLKDIPNASKDAFMNVVPAVTGGGDSPTNGVPSNGTTFPLPPSTVSSGTQTPAVQSAPHIPAIPIPANAQLHAVSISQYCFKHGRVTVPPRVALTLAGFGTFPAARHRWDKLLALRDDKKKMRNIMRGAWRDEDGGDVTLGEGFWEFEEFEREGVRRGREIRKVKEVMDALAGR